MGSRSRGAGASVARMKPEWSEVLEAALALPEEARGRLAEEIVASLTGVTLDAEEEEELAAAMEEADRSEGVDGEEFMRSLRAELGAVSGR